jgi:aspartate aminotransferase
MPQFSQFAESITAESAFTVLAAAKNLKAAGKRVIELEIGDSPFPAVEPARLAALRSLQSGLAQYGPSAGQPAFREAAAQYVQRRYGLAASAANITAGPGAKPFELFFCEAFLNPGDGVLVFSPYFPTYLPNIARRGGRVVLSELQQAHEFRPSLSDIERFLKSDPQPRAIFLNSPHNPTGGVATLQDLKAIADLVRGSQIMVFADEPYDRMVWRGAHHSLLAQPDMFEHCVAAYTFSKSFSMSGWRLGFYVSHPAVADRFAQLANTVLSCVPPFVQEAGVAALTDETGQCERRMKTFRQKLDILIPGLNQIAGVQCLDPAGTFYAFPCVKEICNRLQITSHGLALYFLAGAADDLGVACLGGECFGAAGAGFLRFSCSEPDENLRAALEFLPVAIGRTDRVERYLQAHPEFRLRQPYPN